MCCFISSQQKVGESHSPRGTWLHATSARAWPCDKTACPSLQPGVSALAFCAWRADPAGWVKVGRCCVTVGPGQGGQQRQSAKLPAPHLHPPQAPAMDSQLVHVGPCVSRPGQPTAPMDTTGQRRHQVSASLAVTPTVIPTIGNTQQPPGLPTRLSTHTLRLLLPWLTCPSSSGQGSHPSPSTERKRPPPQVHPEGLPAKTHQTSQAPQETDPQGVTAQKPLEPGVLVQKANWQACPHPWLSP